MRLGPALLGAGVLLAAALAGLWALSADGPTIAGANGVQPALYVADVRPRQRICSLGEALPAGASGLLVTAGSYTVPTAWLEARLLKGTTLVASGHVTAPQGRISIPLHPVRSASLEGVTVCVVNRNAGRVAIAGVPWRRNPLVLNGGRPTRARVSLVFTHRRADSWLDTMPAIAQRAGLANASPFGSWTLWVLGCAVAGSALLAGFALTRRPSA